jgi:hypothetical protein
MPGIQISPEIHSRISGDAKLALDTSFGAFVQRRRDMARRNGTQHEFTEALIRTVLQDEQVRKVSPVKSATLREALAGLSRGEGGTTRPQVPASPAARALTIWPFRTGGDSSPPIVRDTREDAKLQVLVPPYADSWTSAQPSGNADARANADPAAGTFGFLDGAAGGSAACGAGVWVQFIPDGPLPRAVEVRAYTPYSYQWDDVSQLGYTAHNDAGFGIYVLSWDMQGGDRRLEQDYRYSVWSDGTGWSEEHHNPSWDNPDDGYAYIYGNEAPYFEAQPGRIYRAAIWCFGTCDAGSGFFGNAISAADINAKAGFVVIGEQ